MCVNVFFFPFKSKLHITMKVSIQDSISSCSCYRGINTDVVVFLPADRIMYIGLHIKLNPQ